MAGFVEKRNGRYRARFTPPGGKEVSETFDLKRDADDWLDEQRGAAVRGHWIDPRGAKTLFGEVAGRFMEAQVHLRESSAAKLEGDLRNHILPTFERSQLRAIGAVKVQNWVTSLTRKGLAPSTVEVIYGLLSMIMTYAVTVEKLIVESPCSKRINLPVVKSKVTIPDLEWLELVHGRLPARYRRAVPTVAGTGVRQGELFGLTQDRIDFPGRRVRVDRQLQRRPRLQAYLDEHGRLPKGSVAVPLGGGLFLVEPKSERSTRWVPIGNFAVRTLAAQLAEFPPATCDASGVGLVFTTRTGRPVIRSVIDSAWELATRKRLVSDPGLPDPDEYRKARDPDLGRYFTIHDGRHYFASLLIAKGLSVIAVAEILGNSPRECEETYGHLWPTDHDRARDAADDVLDANDPAAESDGGVEASGG